MQYTVVSSRASRNGTRLCAQIWGGRAGILATRFSQNLGGRHVICQQHQAIWYWLIKKANCENQQMVRPRTKNLFLTKSV
jgi:hypothetical protein